MKRYIGFILGFVFLAFLSTEGITSTLQVNSSTSLLPVPIIRQSTEYSCGAAALLSVLYYWQASNLSEFELHEPLKTTKEFGTHPKSLANFTQSIGLKTNLKTEVTLTEIEAAIDRKEPVIVDYQAWGEPKSGDYSEMWESGHYGVIVGYTKTHLFIMDPVLGTSYGRLEKKDFLKRWHDYELENGINQKYIQLAIFISGSQKLLQFPGPLSPIK